MSYRKDTAEGQEAVLVKAQPPKVDEWLRQAHQVARLLQIRALALGNLPWFAHGISSHAAQKLEHKAFSLGS